MTHILHIDASPRGESASHWLRQRSISRTLSRKFITEWKAAHPNDTITYRDLGHYPVPFVTSPTQSYDLETPYLRLIFGFMGITDIEFIHANGLDMGDEARKRGLDEAQSKIQELVNI